MFEIKEISQVEATGSLWGSGMSWIGTWASVALLSGEHGCKFCSIK